MYYTYFSLYICGVGPVCIGVRVREYFSNSRPHGLIHKRKVRHLDRFWNSRGPITVYISSGTKEIAGSLMTGHIVSTE